MKLETNNKMVYKESIAHGNHKSKLRAWIPERVAALCVTEPEVSLLVLSRDFTF